MVSDVLILDTTFVWSEMEEHFTCSIYSYGSLFVLITKMEDTILEQHIQKMIMIKSELHQTYGL